MPNPLLIAAVAAVLPQGAALTNAIAERDPAALSAVIAPRFRNIS